MDEYIRGEILKVLRATYKAVKKKDIVKLNALSDKLTHSSSIYQDKYSIGVAVLVYSLFKIIEKNEHRVYKDWNKFYEEIKRLLLHAIIHLKKDQIKSFEHFIKRIMDTMKKQDQNVGLFVQKIIESSKVKKGSKLYEHGLSSGLVAELLGVTQWELMDYVGAKQVKYYTPSSSIKQRLAFTRRIFNLK